MSLRTGVRQAGASKIRVRRMTYGVAGVPETRLALHGRIEKRARALVVPVRPRGGIVPNQLASGRVRHLRRIVEDRPWGIDIGGKVTKKRHIILAAEKENGFGAGFGNHAYIEIGRAHV